MKKNKVLILGASGMLGKSVIDVFSLNTNHTIYVLSRNYQLFSSNKIIQQNVDLTNIHIFSEILKNISPDLIINCAANIDIEICEQDKKKCDLINADIVKTIYSSVPNVKLVYISTDSVFDGLKGEYEEKDTPNPINNYARSKLLGEKYTLELMRKRIVIRTNIYGINSGMKKSLFEWALHNLNSNINIFGFENVYFNPLYTKQLATIILDLINIEFDGLIHVGSDKFISKYDFIRSIVDVFNFNSNLLKKSKYFKADNSPARPLNTTLSTKKLFKILGYVPSFEQGIYDIKKDYILNSNL